MHRRGAAVHLCSRPQRAGNGGRIPKFFLRGQLPAELKGWSPKEKAKLAPPGFRYYELETVKEFGYSLTGWEAEHPRHRGELMAHEIHRLMREGYLMEVGTEKPRSDGMNTFLDMKSRMGLK